jgi:hypothetical protein
VTQKDWQQWASLQIIPRVNDPSENKEKACGDGGNHDTKCWEKARRENNATTFHILHPFIEAIGGGKNLSEKLNRNGHYERKSKQECQSQSSRNREQKCEHDKRNKNNARIAPFTDAFILSG